MATRSDVLQAVAAAKEARRRAPAVLRRLMRYFDVTDGDLAEAFGVSRQTVNAWANERTRIPEEIEDGLSAYFLVPKEVLHSSPDNALRWVLDHPTDQRIVESRAGSRPKSGWFTADELRSPARSAQPAAA